MTTSSNSFSVTIATIVGVITILGVSWKLYENYKIIEESISDNSENIKRIASNINEVKSQQKELITQLNIMSELNQIVGLKGDRGLKGERGEQGEKGEKGEQGKKGDSIDLVTIKNIVNKQIDDLFKDKIDLIEKLTKTNQDQIIEIIHQSIDNPDFASKYLESVSESLREEALKTIISNDGIEVEIFKGYAKLFNSKKLTLAVQSAQSYSCDIRYAYKSKKLFKSNSQGEIRLEPGIPLSIEAESGGTIYVDLISANYNTSCTFSLYQLP